MNKFYNGKIKCVSSNREDSFETDKTYEVKKGIFKDEQGVIWHKGWVSKDRRCIKDDDRFKSLAEINNRTKTGCLFRCCFEEVSNTSSQSSQSIHIYTDGNTTTCVMKDSNGVIKRTQAKCSPEDTFDFETGARIAFDRCCTSLAESSAFSKIREVKRFAEEGEYIKVVNSDNHFLNNYKNGDILKVKFKQTLSGTIYAENGNDLYSSEYVVLEGYAPPKEVKKEFIPHLEYPTGTHCGNIGEETIQTAFGGEKLYVGDCVSLYNTTTQKTNGIYIVAKDNVNPKGFIMGVASNIFKNGISHDWQIQKVKSFKDLKHNEFIDGIKVVLTDENK